MLEQLSWINILSAIAEDSRKTLNKPIFKRYPDVKLELDRWVHEQSEQHILMKAPYGLSGYRVKVYRIGSTTQWFTAVITGHDLMTRDLVVMDDTVLESHTENPAHVHMMFLDDVVNSLLKGENVGITSRRRAAAAAAAVTGNNNSQATSVTNFSRSINSSHSPATSSLNYQSPQAPKKKRTKGVNDSAPQELEKETKEKAIRQEKSLKEKEKTISNKTKKERKRKPEEIINEELKTLSETVKKTKSSSGSAKDPLRQDTSEPAASGGTRSPAEERLQSQSSEETGTSTHQEGSEAPRVLPPGHKHEPVITHKPSVSPAALPPGGGGGIDPSSGSESLKQSMSNYRTDSEAKDERESVDSAAAVKNGPSAASSTKESNVRKSPPPPITAPSSLGKVSGTSDDKSQPLSSSSSSSNKDTSFLFKLSQAISASPGKRAVKSERDTPFTHAIAGIIARELSKDYENLEKDQAKQEGAEQPVGKEQPITGSTTSVPTTSASVSSSPNLFSSMQTMISAQVSAQEAVIPAVPSEAMVKNCLMQTMSAGPKQPPVSSPKEVRPSSATPPSQRVHSSAARSDPEKAAASPRRKVEKGPSVSSVPHVAPKMSEKPRNVEIERKDREAAVNHERKEKIKKEMHEFREGREGSRQEAIHRSKESAGGFGGGQKEPVRVFRDPNLRDNNVTHVHSIQHHLYHQMGKQDHHKATPVPSSHTPLSTLRTAATPGGPISGSPSAFAPSNLHSNALQPPHAILPPHIQLYPHHLQGFSYSPLHAVDQHGFHQQQQHLAELMALRHQLGLSGLVPGQPAALMQAGAAHGLTQAQLQAILQSQHAGAIAMPPGILIPHTQEDLEIAHLQAQQREQQKLHAEKVAQMETKAILHADKHLFSSSPHPPQHARLTPQTTSSAGSTHHPLGHDGISYRGGGDIRNHHQDVPMVDVHAAIERHFQESLGKPHVAFSISPYSSASGSITMGTPLAKTDHRSVSSEKELQQKEQLEQDRLRREREEKELEWQRLQREKEYKQNQIQKEMERKIMYPSSGIVSERERLQKLASSIDVKNDDHLYKHVMSQLKPKYIGLSSAEKKSEKILIGDSIGSAIKSHSSQGFQVFQPYKSGSGSNKPSSGLKYEEARPGVPVRTEHNRLKSAPAYMLPFQPKTHLEGYVPFGHTVSSSKKHEDKGDNGLLGHRGSSHSPHGISHEDKKGIPNPPPLIKNEPGLGSHDYRDGHTIHEMGAKSLWEKQIVESLKAQQGLLPVKSEGPYSVPVIVRRSESGHHPHMQHIDSSPLKVASPQQLSRAALQTMEVKSMSTASSSRATLSQSSPGVNISTSVVSQSSILMNALRPSEHHHHHHHHHHRKVDKQSYEPKDLSLGTKRKSPNQPMAVKKRVKEAAVMGVATSDKDFRKAGAVTSFSEHCQSYQPKEQSSLVSGGGVTHAKVSENVELKIEKVDQLKRVPPDPGSVQRLTGLPNLFAKNGSLSDSERSRSVSPRSMSDSSDSRKTASPNRTATGHVKCKKAWLQRLSESTDSPPPPEEKKDFKSGTAAKSLPNGHIHSPNATSTVTEKSTVTLSDIQKSIPERVYDFDSMSTCSDSSSASGGSKPRQRRSRENKKSRKRTASPLVVNPSCIIDTSHHPLVNGLNLGLETKVKVDGMGDHKQVTASLIDLMTEAPKKRIVTRAHKEKDREAFNLERSLSKPAISKLKKTGEAFLQDGPCTNITPNLMKCRECRMKGNKQSKLNIFCRFYAFRRLRYSQKGNLTIAGFSELDQYEKEDLGPWLPTRIEEDDPNTDLEVSKYIMLMTADKFCELVLQEKDAKGALTCTDGKMAWKRPVSGVREMCDTCDTTLFNIHWTCPKCGFVVCPDCFKAKTGNSTRSMKAKSPEVWLKCIKDQQHLPENLMLTQIIPGSALWDICTLVHEIRRRWNLPSTCPCSRPKSSPPGDAESTKGNDVKTEVQPEQNAVSSTMVSTTGNTITATSSSTSALDFLADVATSRSNDAKCDFEAPHPPPSQNGETQVDSSSNVKTAADTTTEMTCDPTTNSPTGQNCSTLRELLTKTASKMGTPGGPVDGSSFLSALLPKKENSVKSKHRTMTSTFEDIIATVVEQHIAEPRIKPDRSLQKPSRGPFNMFKSPPAIQTGSKNTLTESSFLYPDVPHSWLCDGKLLRLHEPSNKGNFKIFQEQWGKGVPVLVSNVQKQLKSSLWNPRYFSKQFGNIENDLVDCRKGTVIQGAPMKDFWDGFEDLTNRLETKQGQSMILKLKDWPPAEDFSEILPEHFEDLMGNLPLPEYTRRDGVLNLSSRLPDFFVKPDLGPKMYNAYGLARYPCAGTTNLHLDISDAVNVMVHVGIPHGGQKEDDKAEALISEAVEAVQQRCKDEQTRQRLIEDKETPGALWHIFRARDAPRIRSFLNKLSEEQGEQILLDHDPIHDQSWYLDEEKLARLKEEYKVEGWAIAQCLGDAVFIPAGAPHQVRNLHSCIKVAEDFVSPEHIKECVYLTDEFRHLSNTHSNHEDKLQIKNILYHAIKDAIGVLMSHDPLLQGTGETT
ncbi:uncharacterized protein [Apostichopus japonicus]|uniref:uncharacterized protein isoform X4 n=1 Tax=Stichopus japonicus TaxID=307972 RepID=UPI003AB77686